MYRMFILSILEKYNRVLTEPMLYFGQVVLRSPKWDKSDATDVAKTMIFISWSFEYLNIWCDAK